MHRTPTFRILLAVAILVLSAVGTTFAVLSASAATTCGTSNTLPGSNFEIDTNGNLKVDGPSPCIDWLSGGTGTQLRPGVLAKSDLPSGSSDDAFGKGTSEDDANPSIVDGSIPPQKSDLKVFGIFTETSNGAKYLELFWSRVQNPSGTTNMDFELNQLFCDPTANPTNCANNGITPAETPLRSVGDKLISYDLSKGGTVPVISIRSWGGSAWGSPTIISGPGGSAIGSVNSTAIPASEGGALGSLDAFTFGEVALRFDALFPSNGPCGTFGSAYLKSRSSDSFSAEVKDFIAPEPVKITNCASLTTSATPSVTIGSTISDTATLSNVTTDATGKISFKAFATTDCSGTPAFASADIPVNGPGQYNSGNFMPAAVGTYKWTATYSGDVGNSSAASACNDTGETSQVIRAVPSIVTNATGSAVIEGSLTDTATLSGATTDAGGSITFTAFSTSDCSGTPAYTSAQIAVSGNGKYGSGSPPFTPTSVGTYKWIASYSGDAKNQPAAGTCGDANETSSITRKQPAIMTSTPTASVTVGSAISDSATLSGGTTDIGGTITFNAYSTSDCSGPAAFTSTATVCGNGNYGSGNFSQPPVGTYKWIASYGGDTKNMPVSGSCGDMGETSVVNKAPSSTLTAQTIFPQDSATISAGAGGTPAGTVRFQLFGPNNTTCAGPAVYDSGMVSLNGSGSASTSNTTFSVSSTGAGGDVYRWLVTYSGDTTHNGSTSACGVEQFTIGITNGPTS